MPQNAIYPHYPSPYGQVQYQFSNFLLSLPGGGDYFPYITALSYSDTVDVAEGRGISPYRIGTTLGEYKANGSIEVQKMFNDQFIARIAAQSPTGQSIYDAIFDLTGQYQIAVPPGYPQPPVVSDELVGCRLVGGGQDMSVGNGVLVVKYTLDITLIKWNGRLPLGGLKV